MELEVSYDELKINHEKGSVTISVYIRDSNWDDFIGDSEWTIPNEVILEYVSDCGISNLPSTVQGDLESIQWKPFNDDDITTSSLDFAIIMVNQAMSMKGSYDFEVSTSHIFWALHDVLHAEYDVHGGEIYVSASAENDRHFEAFLICCEQNLVDIGDYELFNQVAKESRLKFDTDYFGEYVFKNSEEELSDSVVELLQELAPDWYYPEEEEDDELELEYDELEEEETY